jgi:hypothetical protein
VRGNIPGSGVLCPSTILGTYPPARPTGKKCKKGVKESDEGGK